MNNADRARELLIEARRRISENQNTFICAAILDAENDRDAYARASLSLREWIMDLLLPYTTYGGWISNTHPKICKRVCGKKYHAKSREGRLAWIDWMLTQDLGKIVRKYNR